MHVKKIPQLLSTICSLFALILANSASADIHLPRLLSDGAILQRDAATSVWGWAEDGEAIEVRLDGKVLATTTTENGEWRVLIPAQSAGGPHEITVTGDTSITIDDVYFGDVWVASGQSNMELPMERVKEKYPDVIATANHPLIRQYKVAKDYDFDAPYKDLPGGQWVASTPESVLNFSAVGFFFAKSISDTRQVPIGIIGNSYGGSPAEAWMSEQALEEYPHYLKVARSYREEGYLQSLLDANRKIFSDWNENVDRIDEGLAAAPNWSASEYDDSGWQTFDLPQFWADTSTGPINGVVWFRKEIEIPEALAGRPAKLMLGRIIDADTAYINGTQVGNTTYQYPPRRYDVGNDILRAGKNTIAVRVVNSAGNGGFVNDKPYWLRVGDTTIDLEGEWLYKVGAVSEAIGPPEFVEHRQPLGMHNAMLAPLLKMTIKGVIWYQGETNTDRPAEYVHLFPAMIRDWRANWKQGDFPFLFVQLANFMEARDEPVESGWAETRNAQFLALREPNTAMAVTIDVGEWNDIHPLNKRAVGERLALVARSVAYGESELVFSGPVVREVHARANELVIGFDHVGSGLRAHGDRLEEFAIAGADRVFVWANAIIDGDTVVVSSESVREPAYVRYAWADNPDGANLYNAEGLPAPPFEAAINSVR